MGCIMEMYINNCNEKVIKINKTWKLYAWNDYACQIVNEYKNISDLMYCYKGVFYTSFTIPKYIQKLLKKNIKEIENFLGVCYED